MSKALKKRNAYKANVTKEVEKLRGLYSDGGNLDQFRAILSKFQSYKQKVDELSTSVLDGLTDDTAVDKEVADSTAYDEWFLNIISKLSAHVDRLSSPASPAVQPSAAAASSLSASASVKLPKLEISKFSGEPMKWREFWDSYVNTIDKSSQLADIDKFKYLKGYLEGDALRLCEGYSLSSENYKAVKAVLEERFGNPQLAIFSHLTALIEQPPASHSVKDLQKIFDECEKHVRSLVGLGLKEDQYGLVFTPIILSKLPLHVKMELHRKNGAQPWTLSSLRVLLKQEIHARDMSERQFVQGQAGRAGDPKPFSGNSWSRNGSPGSGSAGGKANGSAGKGGGFRPFSGSQLGVTGKRGSFRPRPCAFCGEVTHKSDHCPNYPDHQSRKSKIGTACVRCLNPNHSADQCPSKSSCVHCKKQNHHSSLCFSLFSTPSSPGTGGRSSPPNKPPPSGMNPKAPHFTPTLNNCTVHGTGSTGVTNMQTALASCAGSDSGPVSSLRLLFDTAGFRTYITTSAAKSIGASKVGEETMSLGVFEDKRRRTRSYDVVEFFVRLPDGSSILVKANVTDFITCPIFTQPLDSSANPILSQICVAEPASDKPRNLPVDILIGGDQYYDFVTSEQIRLTNGLILLSSKLGYITAGASSSGQATVAGQTLLLTSNPSVADKELNLEQFWRVEEAGTRDEKSCPADELGLQQVNSTRLVIDGRYFVRFPRRDNAAELPANKELAQGRLRSLLRKLSASNPPMFQKYHDILTDQVNRGIIEEAPVSPTGQVHYLPHHCVFKPDSLTTPVRVVHDASAKIRKSALSLNDTLYAGPLFLANLIGLLIRFRLHHVAIVSDIEKAFLHIGLQESDRDLVRFLWVRDPSKPPMGNNVLIYRFCRVPFGLVCSSFLLAACVLHHLSLYSKPAAKLMADNLYVDNIIVSLPTLAASQEYYRDAKEILADASLNLRQWFTNDKGLRGVFAKPDVGKGGNITKVLGMVWDTETDRVSCASVNFGVSVVSTKRELVQCVAKIYDPCGLFSPVVLLGKLLVQRAWKEKLQWDDPLPVDFQQEWVKAAESIKTIPDHSVPRLLCQNLSTDISLHCFCDASKKCYAAAVYIKSTPDQEANLLLSKTTLAPLKGSKVARDGLTIPQLELLAVLIGCRLISVVCQELHLNVSQSIVWSDSQCVLHWVARRGLSTRFVTGKVKEIIEIAKDRQLSFRYVRSENNPADLASRGCHTDQLASSQIWWHGPSWLAKPAAQWPITPVEVNIGIDHGVSSVESDDEGVLPIGLEFKNAIVLLGCSVSDDSFETVGQPCLVSKLTDAGFPASILNLVNYEKFSSLDRLIRTTAAVKRFVDNCRIGQADRASGPLSSNEISTAKTLLISGVQAKNFLPIVSGRLDAKSRQMVTQLKIIKDQSGFLRCDTRLELADADPSVKSPILLPSSDHFSDLVICDIHCRLFHAGTVHCFAEIRQNYWIPKVRSRIKKVIANCKLCQRLKALHFKYPQPPPLPSFRVNRQEVFGTTGVDYLGPLTIRTPMGDKKVWILLFTCAVVRAIHLEAVDDMTTEQFLLAFRKFSALHGCPTLMVSDNAKHFKTAKSALAKACDDGTVRQTPQSRRIEWKFIPERSPWFGGFYERLVASVKRCLRAALYFAKITLSEMQTLVYEVSACLNSRPLTYVDSQLDSVPLCPANFLLKGRPIQVWGPVDNNDWEPNSGGKEAVLVLSWRRNRAMLDKFWNMWQRAYLTSLKDSHRSKFERDVANRTPQLGMTVLVSDKMPKGQWQLARIVALHESSDGVARSADVQLANGTRLKRSLKLLCPLELSVENFADQTPRDPKDQGVATRPVRQAAVLARSKIRAFSNADADDADDEQNNTADPTHAAVMVIGNCPISGMASAEPRTIWVSQGDRLSRFFVYRPGFFIAGRCFTSIHMATTYIQLVQDSREQLAHEMHLVGRLRDMPAEIPRWLKERGYTPSATAVFNAPQIFKSILLTKFHDQEGPLYQAISSFLAVSGFEHGVQIIACGKNYAYEAGLRFNAATAQAAQTELPGFNEYGIAMTEVMEAIMRHDVVPDQFADILLTVPGFIPREVASQTVLVLSDSFCGSIKEIEAGTVIFRSGATFEDILKIIETRGIHFGHFAYVVIHCGINDIQRGRLPAQVMFLRFLEHLQTVEVEGRQYPPSRILISLPILDPDIPEAYEYSVLLRHYCEPRGIRTVDWTTVDCSPFIENYTWRERTTAGDLFHVNHAGITELWKAWARVFPRLRRVHYAMKPDPVRFPRRRH